MSKWAGKTPTADEWREILEKHAKWSRSEAGGERANLADAYLTRANLTDANLTRAYLTRANLTDANLTDANLTRANLTDANLTDANLTDANLTRANLTDANLAGAYLVGANLTRAKGADLAIARTRILPEGDLIGWKKCRNDVIVQLLIPQAARRSHAFGRKCRAEAAVPMAIFPAGAKAESLHAKGFFYEVNVPVKPDKWDEDWQNECGGGIHFYITRAEAKAHAD